MKVSVVIPAYDARRQLTRLLMTLNHSRLGADDSLEVVVADDGSSDGTREMVAAFPAGFNLEYTFIPRTPTSGRAAARNAGIARATGDLVVMVDADQVVEPHFLAEHIRFHRIRDDLVVIGPRSDLGEGEVDDELLAREFSFAALPPVVGTDLRQMVLDEFSANLNQMATCWHYLFTCNVSVRLDHLRAVGGFDEAFVGWGLEDAELGYRLRKRGLAFAFNSAAVVYHQKGRDVDSRMYAEWRRNLDYIMRKHNAPEVAIQTVLCPGLDPADQRYYWTEGMRRFEYAARALAGKVPAPVSYELVEVDEENLADVRARLPELAATRDLLVIDDTDQAELAGVVQCTDTARDLRYFHRPGAARRERILHRYPARPLA